MIRCLYVNDMFLMFECYLRDISMAVKRYADGMLIIFERYLHDIIMICQ